MWPEIIVLAVVEGITEFLPISSTGHLIIAKSILGLESSPQLNAFLVIVQAGAILAVISVFWRLFLKWVMSWIRLFRFRKNCSNLEMNEDDIEMRRQSLLIFLSVVPFGIIGFILKDYIKTLFSLQVVSWALIVGGVFIVVAERLMRNKSVDKSLNKFGLLDSLIVGLGQCLALWPGFSRAGATLIFARFRGFSRATSAEISFLIGLPTLLGTAGYETLKEWHNLDGQWVVYLVVGIFISWSVAYICVKTFVAFLKKFSLSIFGYYRIAFGLGLLWFASKGIIV